MSDGIEPKRYLITIGAPSCEAMGLQRLTKVKGDVEEVVRLFEAQGYIHELRSKIKPTTTAPKIKAAVSDWFKEPSRQPSDHVVIYYAGHAGKLERFDDYCLYAIDSDEEEAESLIEIKHFVKSFYLRKDQQHPRNVLFILDACYAGAGGNAIAEALGSLNDSSPEGGFWVICAAGSHDQAIDGSFVEALKGVLCPTASKVSEDEFISPDTFIGAIKNYLESRYDGASTREEKNLWKQQCQGSTVRYTDQARFIRNPHFSKLESRSGDLAHIALELQKIDFTDQRRVFSSFLASDHPVGAFFLEVSDDDPDELQQCLVSRLARSFEAREKQCTKFYGVRIRQRGSLERFCEWIALGLGLSMNASLDEIHEQILQTCQTQSMLIALYCVPRMEDDEISRLFEIFWRPLERKFLENQSPTRQGRLVFLLAGAKPMIIPNNFKPENYLKLDQILTTHIEDWFSDDDVQTLINQLNSSDIRDNLLRLYQNKPEQSIGKNAYDAMTLVCKALKVHGELDALKRYWTLSGDSRR
jgi:hypothetical protein